MKKNLLLTALVIPLLSVSAQWTQVGGTVSVKPNTLKYVAQDYKVSGVGSKTTNEGNVNVRGNFTIDNETEPTTEFRNKFNSGTQYGQLILQDGSGQVVTGKIHNEFKLSDSFDYHPFAIPFTNYTSRDLTTNAGMGNVSFLGFNSGNFTYDYNRWKNPVWHWELDYFRSSTPAETDELVPGFEYSINNMESALTSEHTPNTTSITTYIGTPNNFSVNSTDNSITLIGYNVPTNISSNIYGEVYGSYITDFGSTKPLGWDTPRAGVPVDNDFDNNGKDYGNNIYLLGNPYTSNIDLESQLLANQYFTHIAQSTSSVYVREDGNGETVEGFNFIAATSDGTGDQGAFVIRPFHTFSVKMGNLGTQSTDNTNISLNDAIKTFDDLNAPSYARIQNNLSNFYQVGLDLYNSNGVATGNRIYVVAGDSYGPAATAGNEVYNISLSDDDIGFYTLQENEDGSVNEELINNKVYINGINATNYVAKPIHLVFQTNNSGTFTIKPRLNEALLNSANKFYFEDSDTSEIFEITEDFSYTFSAESTETERFKMYWNGTPEVLNVSDLKTVAKTLVYKNVDETFKVRFAEHWNKADIFVYNVMGQLVHSAKSVDASIDYPLPLKGQISAYIVKAVSDKGEVSTQKIIKK